MEYGSYIISTKWLQLSTHIVIITVILRCTGLDEVSNIVWLNGDGNDWVSVITIDTSDSIYCSLPHSYSTYTYPPTMTLLKDDDGTMETAEDAMLRELQV